MQPSDHALTAGEGCHFYRRLVDRAPLQRRVSGHRLRYQGQLNEVVEGFATRDLCTPGVYGTDNTPEADLETSGVSVVPVAHRKGDAQRRPKGRAPLELHGIDGGFLLGPERRPAAPASAACRPAEQSGHALGSRRQELRCARRAQHKLG